MKGTPNTVVLKRYIPFSYETESIEGDKRAPDAEILDPYKVDKFTIDQSSQSWFDMRLLAKKFDTDGIDHRNFPLLVESTRPVTGSMEIGDQTTDSVTSLNYLATVVFGLINASRQVMSGSRDQMSDYISGISNYLNSIIQMDKSLEGDIFAMSAMIDSAMFMLQEIAPDQYTVFKDQLVEIEVESDGALVVFNLIDKTDIIMEQEIYVYDSKVGFLVNHLTITYLDRIDEDTLFSLDLLYRLCSGGFSYNEEEDILRSLKKKVPTLMIKDVKFMDEMFDLVGFDESINYSGLVISSLLDNPLIELYDSDLRSNLFLLKLKDAKSLLAQADFRTSLKNQGSFRNKLTIFETVSFMMQQIFHEETQTSKYLKIYTKKWENWYDRLGSAMNYSLLEAIAGGTRNLQDIYFASSRLELFFTQQSNNLNLPGKIGELASTMNYHLFFCNFDKGSLTILPKDIDETGNIKTNRLELLNQESSYLEYIDPKLFLEVVAERLTLDINYKSFRDLHKNLEETLASVQEIVESTRSRLITIAIVIFSITELTLAFLEVFGAIFGV